MIIDRILDRYDGDAYDPKEFYDAMMSYEEGTDYKISRAMDSGEEEDIRRELCAYIDDAQYNPKIKDFINSVAWLEPDNGKKYKAEIDILGESKKPTCSMQKKKESLAKKSEADYGAMTWTVTVEFDDNGKSVRKDYVVKAHNRESAVDQAKLRPLRSNPDAKDIKVTYCKLGESLAKKNESSLYELRVSDEDVAIVIHDIDRFDDRFDDSMIPGDGEEFTLPEFRQLVGDLAETSNGFATVSRDGANIRVAIEVPQENDEGELTDQYKEELVLSGTARIHDDSLDRVADYLNDYLDHR